MTEPYTGQTFADDIEQDVDSTSARLDRQADAILLEGEVRAFAARPLRRAMREDAGLVATGGSSGSPGCGGRSRTNRSRRRSMRSPSGW